jgi:2-keto-4-pentenoate hydratase/2-oxohepta-3-ene-1,7-dioic acid hydratase in catechol pathway
MKIICIGKNYSEHAKEMKSTVPSQPVIFMKPDTAILRERHDFYLPEFSKEIHHEVELVYKINRLGKNISEQFAHRYYDHVTVGIDFTARDLQAQLKEKGHPWEISKAFDHSAPVGRFIPLAPPTPQRGDQGEEPEFYLPPLGGGGTIHFHLDINGNMVQQGSSHDMIFSIDKIIAYVSRFLTLCKGDLIFTGTPVGVGQVKAGDLLEAFIGEKKLLKVKVK